MIGGVFRALDNVLGRGEAAVTIPPLDGALRSNRLLDEASWRSPLPSVDCLAIMSGRLFASAGREVFSLESGNTWRKQTECRAEVTCIASIGDSLAIALGTGEIVMEDVGGSRSTLRVAEEVRCITAMAASGTRLYVANGSAANATDDWQLDLLQRNNSGSIWELDLESGKSRRVAHGLAYPAGLVIDGGTVVCSEAWEHRLLRLAVANGAKLEVLYTDLPGYPGRLAQASDGYWLAVFAPRSQLVEFVLREPTYRNRMLSDIPKPFWVAPKLRSGRSFCEPLQGGGVKHLGLLKPWAPTMSAGLCVKLDGAFQPDFSLHSRADGATHGVTSAIQHDDRVYAAARGDGVVVALALKELETER